MYQSGFFIRPSVCLSVCDYMFAMLRTALVYDISALSLTDRQTDG